MLGASLRACRVGASLALLTSSSIAATHSGGVGGPDCVGCHGGGDYSAAVTASPATFGPGDTVTMTLTVNASGSVLGTFMAADTGSLAPISGQGLATVPQGITHTSPKNMSGGTASFAFQYTAASQPGAVRLDVSTLVGNGNGKSSGDQGQRIFADFVYGCPPQTYYRDFDGDGLLDLLLGTCGYHAVPSNSSGLPACSGGACRDNGATVLLMRQAQPMAALGATAAPPPPSLSEQSIFEWPEWVTVQGKRLSFGGQEAGVAPLDAGDGELSLVVATPGGRHLFFAAADIGTATAEPMPW